MKRRRWMWFSASVAGVAALLTVLMPAGPPAPPVLAKDPALRSLPLYFYPASDSSRPPRAVVFFFGNDVGFWRPHQTLAWVLAGMQYAVVGLDLRPLLRSLPSTRAARDSAFCARILPMIARSRHELRGDSVPLVIAGHSLGAEVAVWTGAFARPPGTVGILAISPGSRSHLQVSLSDLTMHGEPQGPLSFSVADAIARLPRHERLAIIRGQHDKFAAADSALLGAGGTRAWRCVVPFAGHSLKSVTVARLCVQRALTWIVTRADTMPATQRRQG